MILRFLPVLLLLFTTGCVSNRAAKIEYTRVNYWQWQDISGQQIETSHYILHTTLTDADLIQRLARLMESAHAHYTQLSPTLTSSRSQLPVYVFATHEQWARYTIATTALDHLAYLSVINGGYAFKDQFVCWLTNESDLLTTAAHEGLHQFVARNYLMRLPPTLEEGLASTFENWSVRNGVISFDPAKNPRRQAALRDAIQGNYLIPLDTLLMIHAGDFRDKGPLLREGYYAQAWALASMLQRHTAYRDGLRVMLGAIATGNTTSSIGKNDGSGVYHPDRIKTLMQKYVAPDWNRFVEDYQQTLRELAAPADAPHTSPSD